MRDAAFARGSWTRLRRQCAAKVNMEVVGRHPSAAHFDQAFRLLRLQMEAGIQTTEGDGVFQRPRILPEVTSGTIHGTLVKKRQHFAVNLRAAWTKPAAEPTVSLAAYEEAV